jgi:fimbrial chaperone protein
MVTPVTRRFAAIALAAFSTSLCLGVAASAYQVQPLTYFLTPTGPKSQTRLTVINTDATQLDTELAVFSVDVDVDGKRAFTPADDQFLIFPPQASIKPGAAQSFQVRYIGDPAITQGRIYVVRVKQLNINYVEREVKPGTTSRVAIMLNFNTTAVVQPVKAHDDVAIVSNLTPLAGKDAKSVGFVATVANSGDAVADLSALKWRLLRDGKSEDLEIMKLKFGETSMLAPGAQRRIVLDGALGQGAQLQLASAG